MKSLRNVKKVEDFIIYEDSEEEKYVQNLPYSHFISREPLHWIWPSIRNIPPEKLLKIEKKGFKVLRGQFSDKEDMRIRKNWKRWARQFPNMDDPFVAFGLTHRPPGKTDGENDDDDYCVPYGIRRQYTRLEFMKRMAYKLKERLICDIHARAKRILVYKQFKYHYISHCDDEVLEEVVTKIHEDKEPIRDISRELDVSPNIVSSLKHNASADKPHFWTSVDDMILEECISRQFGHEDIYSIPSFKIDWERAQREMNTCGLNLNKSQIYKRWRRKNPSVFGLRRL